MEVFLVASLPIEVLDKVTLSHLISSLFVLNSFLGFFFKEEEEERLKGVKICKNSPSVSHLMHANDLLVACRANLDSVYVIFNNFDRYCAWSGQEINS